MTGRSLLSMWAFLFAIEVGCVLLALAGFLVGYAIDHVHIHIAVGYTR